MARQLISRDEVPHFIRLSNEFRWGKMTGYTSYQGDYIIKVFGEVMAIKHYDEEGNFDHFWLDKDFAFEDTAKYVSLVKKAITLIERGNPDLVGN